MEDMLFLKELRAARGRFALMISVVGLLTLLLVMLTGLTGGLGKQNTSALELVAPDGMEFSTAQPSFAESEFSADQVAAAPGQTPLGIGITKIDGESVAVFGLPAGTAVGGATVPETGVLDPRTTDGAVPAVSYSHLPVVFAATPTWQELTHSQAVATVLVPGPVSLRDSFAGLDAYKSERGSLVTMQGFLYGIAALVTVAFLSVWTIQRTRDLSILRALGASARYLLSDALRQAAVLLALGVVLGAAIGAGLGAAASTAVPFELAPLTVAGPALGIWALGMWGAFLATRRVTKTDPLIALGGNA